MGVGKSLGLLAPLLLFAALAAVLCREAGSDLRCPLSRPSAPVVSLYARHEVWTGHVAQEGLLTVQTVAPSSINA